MNFLRAFIFRENFWKFRTHYAVSFYSRTRWVLLLLFSMTGYSRYFVSGYWHSWVEWGGLLSFTKNSHFGVPLPHIFAAYMAYLCLFVSFSLLQQENHMASSANWPNARAVWNRSVFIFPFVFFHPQLIRPNLCVWFRKIGIDMLNMKY